MEIYKLTGSIFKAMLLSGAEKLSKDYEAINALNVFPVPDGDTGTNMRMTLNGGVTEISGVEDDNISEVSKKISRGMLMGARGNSGVILSQLFRGINKGFEGYEEVDATILANAFFSGVKQAYKAVMKPVEGTMLTVAREASEKALLVIKPDMTINEFFRVYLKEANESLQRTPDLLPALKEAGVVDSGGVGLICIIEGMFAAIEGDAIAKSAPIDNLHMVSTLKKQGPIEASFGYCTEFILQLSTKKIGDIEKFDEKTVLEIIEKLGDSIVLVKDEDLLKVHIHTLTPGDVLNVGQKYGEFIHLKIENMEVQHEDHEEMITHTTNGVCACGEVHEPVKKPEIRSKYAIVSVATGEGLIRTFKEMGADYVVSGGQSMNPSTEDFIKGYETLNAENIIVFPNNKNITLAARQSAKLFKESNVYVVETTSLAQGFAALTMIDLNDEPNKCIADLKIVVSNVTTGLITYSVRETQLEGLHIKKDDFIGILDGKIVTSCRRKIDAVKALLQKGINDQKEIVTIIYGKDVSEKEVTELVKHIEKNYPNVDVDIVDGSQEVYSYIFAIE